MYRQFPNFSIELNGQGGIALTFSGRQGGRAAGGEEGGGRGAAGWRAAQAVHSACPGCLLPVNAAEYFQT